MPTDEELLLAWKLYLADGRAWAFAEKMGDGNADGFYRVLLRAWLRDEQYWRTEAISRAGIVYGPIGPLAMPTEALDCARAVERSRWDNYARGAPGDVVEAEVARINREWAELRLSPSAAISAPLQARR